jgi:hypothetical protein
MENRVSSRVQRVTGSDCSGFAHIRVTGSPETVTRTTRYQLWPPDMEDRTVGRIGFGSRIHKSPGFSFLGLVGYGSQVPGFRRESSALALPGTTQHHPPVIWTSEQSDFPPPSGLCSQLSVSLSISALNSLSISRSLSLSSLPVSLGKKKKKEKETKKEKDQEKRERRRKL